MRIAICQPYRSRTPDENLDTALRMLKTSKEEYSSELVCFPEAFPFSYRSNMGINGNGVQKIKELCSKLGLNTIYGQIIFEENGFSNSAVAIGTKGELLGRYDKENCFANEQKRYIKQTNNNNIFSINGYKAGITICYDFLMPETARILALKGTDIIINLANIPEAMVEFWHGLVITRAYENHIPIANVSDIDLNGISKGLAMIVEPPFKVIGKAKNPNIEEIVYGEIHPEKFRCNRISKSPEVSALELFKLGDYGPYLPDISKNILEQIIKEYREGLETW